MVTLVVSAIEYLWAHVRREFNRRITKLAIRRDYNQEDLVRVIEIACESIRPEVVAICANQNRKYVNGYLPLEL